MQTPFLPKNAQKITIYGPVGKLDCLELKPNNPESITGCAIIFHPDPKAGGSYTNKVVQTIAKVLNSQNYICYCPNLRGVGQSAGSHDYGVGEIEDAYAIYEYINQHYPYLPIILAGFSFGSSIASQLGNKIPHQKLILVGPAVTRYKVVVPNFKNTIVIHGENDEVIPLMDVLAWARPLNQSVIWVPNTGHFFHGKLIELSNLLNQINYQPH